MSHQRSSSKYSKFIKHTLDTDKAVSDKKEVVNVDNVDNIETVKVNLKRGMRDKMPTYLYDLLATYFGLDDLYQAYGALIRGKAYVDRNIMFESHEGLFSDAIKSVIYAYKRGVVRNLFAVLYTAARDTSAQIYRKENYKVENWLVW